LRGPTETTAGIAVAATAPPETATKGLDVIDGAGVAQKGARGKSERATISELT
jgi:hypothetical protein